MWPSSSSPSFTTSGGGGCVGRSENEEEEEEREEDWWEGDEEEGSGLFIWDVKLRIVWEGRKEGENNTSENGWEKEGRKAAEERGKGI